MTEAAQAEGEQAPDADHGGTAPEDRGTLTIADRVIEKVATMALREIDDVEAQATGWRKALGRSLPRATVVTAGGRSRIGVTVATSWPTPLAGLATRTRDHVSQRVASLTGTDVVAVDVTVSGVTHSAEHTRSNR